MTVFRVHVPMTVADRVEEYADYILERSGFPGIANRWADGVYEAFESLRTMPDRYDLAEEDPWYDYEVRRLLIGRYIATYTVDHESQIVRMVGFRHGPVFQERATCRPIRLVDADRAGAETTGLS